MILHRYNASGLYIVSTEYPDTEMLPILSTFIPPPETTPNQPPFAVFRAGSWFLEETRPTTIIYSSLAPNTTLEAFQAKTVLSQYGLLEAVKSLINHPLTPMKIKLAWENAVPFRRDNPLVLFIAEQLNISVSLLDELFSKGVLITTEAI